jgi:flagellar basal-body rod modification protein FlgD
MSTIPLAGSATAQAATAASSSASASSASGLSQVNFMQLLTAQMQNQDPSSPTSPTDYVTQMAQFSTVQGITQLNQSITSLLSMQGLTQGVGLIGKNVTYTNSAGKTASGTVSSISMVGGQPQLVINNTNISVSQIQTIQAGAKKSSAAATPTTAGSN